MERDNNVDIHSASCTLQDTKSVKNLQQLEKYKNTKREATKAAPRIARIR